MKNNIKNIILDIDNCILNSTEWNKYLPKDFYSRDEWTNYHNYYYLAVTNYDMVNYLSDLCKLGLKSIDFITAREDVDNMRKITIAQLEKALGNIRRIRNVKTRLFMRNYNDFSKSSEVKENILLTHIYPYKFIDLAIDDDKSNLQMYEKYGIKTLYYDKYI